MSERPKRRRLLRWQTDIDCDRCGGCGFYEVELRWTNKVKTLAGKVPSYEENLVLRAVCGCVTVE